MDGPVYIPRRIDYIHDVFRPKQFVPEKTIDESREMKHMSVYGGEHGNECGDLEDKLDGDSHCSYGNQSLSAEEKKEAERLYQRIREIERMHPSPIDDCEALHSPQWSGDGEGTHHSPGQFVSHSTPTPVIPSTVSTLQPGVSEVRFVVDQCACSECSPVVLSDGSLFCDLCHVPILRDTWVSHTRSICHQMKRWNGVHQYINPYMKPSSQAYHLMQSMGWKEGEGLGIQGQGRLEPIATRLKNNRLGIGARDSA